MAQIIDGNAEPVPVPVEAARLRGKPFLIDSNESYFPKSLPLHTDPALPKLFLATSPNFADIDVAAAELNRVLEEELIEYGAIIVRGLPLKRVGVEQAGGQNSRGAEQHEQEQGRRQSYTFSELLLAMKINLTKYVGGVTSRAEAEPMVYPASEENPAVCMDLHQDNTYWPVPPKKLFFYYEQVAKSGGLNPLLDMRAYLRSIPLDIVAKFQSLGVRYENYYPNASVDSRFVPWQSSFKTEDKAEVAHLLKEGNFEFEWTASGGLRKWNVLSPFKDHPVTGEKMWVNMIVANHASYFHDHPSFPELANIPYTDPEPISAAIPTATAPSTPAFAPQQHQQQQQHVPEGFEYPFNIKYGDGSNVPYSVIQTLRGLAWERAKAPSAENGDLLIVDNYRVQHGRLGYEAPRKFWIAICLS